MCFNVFILPTNCAVQPREDSCNYFYMKHMSDFTYVYTISSVQRTGPNAACQPPQYMTDGFINLKYNREFESVSHLERKWSMACCATCKWKQPLNCHRRLFDAINV